eukprot:5727079-Pyramimonas_sp.AAC.1
MLVEAQNFRSQEEKKVPESGCMPIPAYDFAEQFSEFSFYSCLTKQEVITATVKVGRYTKPPARKGRYTRPPA